MHLIVDARMINSSGIGRYLRNILPFLLKKYEVTLLGDPQEVSSFSWSKYINLIELKTPIYSIKEQLILPFIVPKADVFWSPHYNIPVLPIKAKKRIVTIHDVCHLAFAENLSFLQKSYAFFMLNKAANLSDIIITISHFSKKEILRYIRTSKRIEVIYNGIDEIFLRKRKLLKLEDRENYILYVGNIKPHKNLVRALRAFRKLKEERLCFKIVGERKNFIIKDKEIEKEAQKISDKVEFLGCVEDEELIELYRKARLFLFPSLYEGFGFPPLEAMALGTPVVASKAASIPEVCGEAAYYVDPYDIEDIAQGISKVLKDKALQQELIEKGHERVNLFRWDLAAQKLIEIIDSLL